MLKQTMAKAPSLMMILALLASSLASFVPAGQALAQTSVFINEIHYDNVSTDAGEAIEIAGPAGTDLTGWSLVLYNGNGGAVYDTDFLSGTIPDLGGGFGVVVVNYAVNGIQNGSPDGIALVDAGSAVVQFLSYEGAFTAAGGPADGMTSVDIGVSEGGSGPVGNSLQLAGTGMIYEDFTWQSEAAHTFDAFNTGQIFGEAAEATLVINEVDYDQPGTDAAEFVEIKNTGSGNAILSEYTLELVNGTGGGASVYQSIALPAVTLGAGDYFVVCGDAANVANCDLDVTPDTNLVQNGAPDGIGLRRNGTLVDAVSYEGNTGAPYTEGSGVGLVDDPADEAIGISRFPDGTDTHVNNLDFSMRCITPGAANSEGSSNCIVSTDVVINEIMQNPSAVLDNSGEWFELYNAGDTEVDINGWTIADNDFDSHVINAGGPLMIPAGGYLVLGNNGDSATNGGVLVDYVYGSSWSLGNSADEVVLIDADGNEIDRVEYDGGPTFPDPNGASMSLRDPTLDNNVGANWCTSATPFGSGDLGTPGAANVCSDIGVCGAPASHAIWEIQGNAATSPLVGNSVIVEGVVVGDFQNNAQTDDGDLNGFYLQEEDSQADSDPNTSNGIFVYGPAVQDVSTGDLLRVGGSVAEYSTSSGASLMTEITNVTQVLNCGVAPAMPAPAEVLMPVSAVSDFEKYEGMLVTFTQPLVISEYFNFDRFNEIVLTVDRQYQPTAAFDPGSPEASALADLNARSRITLDDGRSAQNLDPALHPDGNVFDLDNRFRGGDIVQAATGVIDETFGLYRIQPTLGADYTATNPRPEAPDEVGGGVKVASFNVLNYFTTLNSRGANTPEEFARQRTKIFAALAQIDADVVGLIEIENNEEAIVDLVDGLNDLVGAGTYAFIDTGVFGSDEIKQAFIYKPATVTPLGAYALLDSTVDARFLDDYNRPALAQTFQDDLTGGIFTAVVNHLKSKGSNCNDVGDPDLGDGAGNCNLTRKAAAEALVDWLAMDPTNSGDSDFIIMGDLNSYTKEDPIDAIRAGSDDVLGTGDDYTDLLFHFIGEGAYSYVFDGQLGYLDHALANQELLSEVTGTTVWHINADEPDILDYDMSFKEPAQEALYEPNAYRSSDHDPVIVGLAVCDEIAPTLEVSVSPDTLWSPNHKYVEVLATVTASDNFDPNPTVTLLSVTSNEPDNGEDDGNTVDDIVIVDDFTFLLRAERSGLGTGRVYTITYQVSDACGNTTIASATVTVPLSQGG